MRLKNVGYMQHGHASDYRAGSVVILSGESAEVADEYAHHLLKTFPGCFIVAGEEVTPKVKPLAIEFVEEAELPVRKGKRR